MEQLHCPRSYLIPTRHGIHGITDQPLKIVGALLLCIETNNHQTRQGVYIADNVNGFYLSEAALKDLGVIGEHFPLCQASSKASMIMGSSKAPCGCPLRVKAPTHPGEISFDPIPENWRNWSHRFKITMLPVHSIPALTSPSTPCQASLWRSTLNLMPHPHAMHCPILILHHWKQAVKANLDRDVSLGIIKPVPQGTPTIWCSCMIVAPKNDGSPRRTVDLQKLNQATL